MAKKYIAISEVVRMLKEFRSAYPEEVFPSPVQGGDNTPAMHHAAAVRLTCDNLLGRLPTVTDEVEHEYVGEEAEVEAGRKAKK